MSTLDNQRAEALKKELFDLQDKRKKLEDEIVLQKVILDNNKVGMKESLTDKEDYPRNDIDVYAVRQARAKIIHLENDAKSLLNEMQNKLEELHSLSRPQDQGTSAWTPLSLIVESSDGAHYKKIWY